MKRLSWFILPLLLIAAMLALPACSSGTPAVRVATDALWKPFEYVDEQTKEIIGFDIDLFKAIAEEEGLKLEFINVGFDPLLAGMASGQYDAAISSITITESRKQDMLFSDPYFEAGQMVVVRRDNTTITGKDTLSGVVGAQISTTGAIEVEKLAAAGVTLKTYDDIGFAYQDLMNGQISAVVADNPIAMEYAGKNADKLKMVGGVFTDEQYGIAVAKGKEDLLAKINAGLAEVKSDGLIEELAEKWISSGQ
jgi:polar amino acid transport system substrate-binding protein